MDPYLDTKIKEKPSYLDLDHNGHINNAKYTNFVVNNIKELHHKEIVACQIEYIQELRDEEFDLICNYKNISPFFSYCLYMLHCKSSLLSQPSYYLSIPNWIFFVKQITLLIIF